jgi:hypothetical protein
VSGRWFLPVLIAIVATSASCGGSPEDERAALCEDLGNLGGTVGLIANPPVDSTVGQVRGAIEKLDPTIEQAEDAGVVPDADADGFRAEQEVALDALRGIGDDTSILEVPEDRLAPTDTVVARYRDLMVALDCRVAD